MEREALVCAILPPMKIHFLMLALAVLAGSLRAQEIRASEATAAFAVPGAFVIHPYVASADPSVPRFWTRSTIALAALDGAAKAADSFATRENIDGGGEEYNPLARPFVHTAAVQVACMAALFGAEIATAYFLHRRFHDRVGHSVLAGGALLNGLGAATSFRHRVASW
jgi:hypothetical protein